MKLILFIMSIFVLCSCTKKAEKKDELWKAQNPMQNLGYHLYFETHLSGDDTISCNTCHDVTNRGNGAQSIPVSLGINSQKGGRNSPTVWNAKFLSVQFWDGRAKDLVEQAKGPITNPIEMGMESHDLAIQKIKKIDKYQELFKKAFPDEENPFNIDNAAYAIAEFEKTLTTINSPYDKGEMSKLAQEGYENFKKIGCTSCHSGDHFAGPNLPVGSGFYMKFPTFPDEGLEERYGFSKDKGRFEVTGNPSDKNMWRVPTLRNVARTAPYFHNGSVVDLDTAVRVMGKTQLNRDLSDEEVKSLVAFLNALTGEMPLIKKPENI